MFRFATAAGLLLALQMSSAVAGPCDYDVKNDKTVQPELGQAKEAKADAAAKPDATAKAEVAAKPAEAAAAVKLAKADVPAKAEAPAKPAATETPVKLVKVEPADAAKIDDAAEPEKAEEKAEEEKVVRRGGGNRRGLTPAALALLERIESEFGPVNVISGYRPGARIAGSGRVSRHASGNAIDFDAGSRKGAIVKWLIANHKNGGTMTYAHMGHIHVDIGQHFVSLGSGGGSRRVARSRNRAAARYAEAGYARRDYAYDRDYERRDYGRRSSGYERRGRSGGSYQGQRYASGYATIY